MNFKTTIALIVVLGVAGIVLYFTHEKPADQSAETSTPPAQTTKLINVQPADVQKVVVTPADGKAIALERDGGMNWRMTQPINAPADSTAADSLVSAITDLTSRSKIDAGNQNAGITGLDAPNFRLEITTKSGQTTKLAVGNKSATGGNLYVRLNDEKQADLAPAEFYDQLDKPASSFRSTQVVDVKTPEVSEVQVQSSKGDLSLVKTGEQTWQINAGATTMPADTSEAPDLVMALTGLRATEYAKDELSDATAARYQLDKPVLTATLVSHPSTQPSAASTQPTTQRTVTTLIKFGGYDDIQKRNVYVSTSASDAIAKVPASTITTLEKTPLDLRDRKVVQVNGDQVESISIEINKPSTTQPTTKPAENKTVTLVRRHEAPATQATAAPAPRGVAATQASTTAPATQATATTQPSATTQIASTAPATTNSSTQPVAATKPVEPPSKWQLATGPGLKIDADDNKVEDVLALFSPLRADKFLETNPTTQSAQAHDRYTVTLTTGGASPQTYRVTLIDRATSEPAVAEYNGLIFEMPRTLIERVSDNFAKGATPSTPRREPAGAPGGSPLE